MLDNYKNLGEGALLSEQLKKLGFKLKEGSVTEDKLADDSVSTSKLQDESVNTYKLADKCVTQDKLQINSVSFEKLADNVQKAIKYGEDIHFGFDEETGDIYVEANSYV